MSAVEFAEVLRPFVILAAGIWGGILIGRAWPRRNRRTRMPLRDPDPRCARYPESKPGVHI